MVVTTMTHHRPRPVVLHLLIQIHFVVIVCSLRPSSAGGNHTVAVPPLFPCLSDQASALLRLKRSFATTNESTMAFRSWRAGTDCCGWAGVRCGDAEGRVASLDLGNCRLESGGLDPALFDLTSLENLNLAYNDFNGSQLPSSGFEHLTKLTHLNLSSSSFSGPAPTSIGSLTNLVSLDLSTGFETTELLSNGYVLHVDSNLGSRLIVQNIETLIANLINLTKLHLGRVDLSNIETHWCNVLAKSCPKLQVLSLPYSRLSGSICSSLHSLHSLVVIDLQYNYLSGPIPDFLTNFSNLSVLQLNHNNFEGWISSAIFEHKKLVTIDLHINYEISGYLPNFSTSSNLVNLNVGRTNLSGIIPASIGNLISLRKLGLGASGFFGQIPSSIANLKSLSALEISGKGIIGSIPSWVSNLTSLTTLQFYDCGLSGSLPSFIGDLRYLRNLAVSNCNFSGQIPPYISNLTQMQIILLNSNYISGTMELTSFRKFPDLIALDLSDNNLVVVDGQDNSSLASLPKIAHLSLSGCNMSEFPNFLRHQDEIGSIDLSDNQIHGAIPLWAWETWKDLFFLILANNKFTSIGYSPFLPPQIEVLDLSNNMFEGAIPIPHGSAIMLDYSNNRFSSVPSNFSSHLSDVTLFKASRNNLSGEIPLSFCAGTSIQLLDLSYNNFSGPIPSCLMENVNGMQSLYLNKNQLHGEFPDNIKEYCSFEALDVSGNWIEGQLP
ncbi:receptor-like protein 6 [Phragmites australis]|uniref:receptor-like protein 6 n=1 Tax=Phragmites australis TaxID=29695 RepID=UPI002D7711B0|nr:receptor-like protein 6 [Phragmites australis]